MTNEEKYLLSCLFAVNRIIEKGGTDYGIKIDGKWEMVPWEEVRKWIEEQYVIQQFDRRVRNEDSD